MFRLNLYLILLSFFAVSTAQTQTFESLNYTVTSGDRELSNAWAGGLNNPQVSMADVDQDGAEDIVIFDRDGDIFLVFIADTADGKIDYRYQPQYQDLFPAIEDWAILRDCDGDGLKDLFISSDIAIPGVQLYQAVLENGALKYQLVELDQPYPNVLAHRSGTNFVNVEVSAIDIPTIRDVDGDGDLDILSFSGSGGAVLFYENQQVEENLDIDAIYFRVRDFCWGKFYESDFNETINLSPSPDVCADPALGSDNRLHSGSALDGWDADSDGDLDLVLGDLMSNGLKFLRNGGTSSTAWMTEVDDFYPSYSTSVDLSTFLAPFLEDVDQDDRIDLLVAPNTVSGEAEKTNPLWYYSNRGSEGRDSFFLESNTFLTESMVDFGSKSVPAALDINGDDLLDIVIGVEVNRPEGIYDQSGLILLLNTGTAQDPSFEVADTDYLNMSVHAQSLISLRPAAMDIDNDGDTDLLLGDANGELTLLENTAGPGNPAVFSNPQFQWMGIDVGQHAMPAGVDLNDDGLTDLIIGERTGNNGPDGRCGNLNYFENIGSVGDPFFESDPEVDPNNQCFGFINTVEPNQTRGFSAPHIYEGNERTIFLVGNYLGRIWEYEVLNTTDTLDRLDDNLGGIDLGFNSACILADMDSDDTLEIICGNERGGLTARKTNFHVSGKVNVTNRQNPSADIRIYPNPVRNGGYLNIKSDTYAIDRISIIDSNGRLIHYTDAKGVKEYMEPLSLTPGLYFVRVDAGKGTVFKKLVVTN